jgi:hypothetical protein
LTGGKCKEIPLKPLKQAKRTYWTSLGVDGEGLSANVRGAYGFLAHNYDEGDEIFFFGFSRGAYTARAIAGLVTYMGLLTKRGMDSFPEVYYAYYKHDTTETKPSLPPDLLAKLKENNDLSEGAKKAIKIIGIWDTVGFHGTFGGEKLELWNQLLSPDVQHGYHALALDEERLAFEPTLWDPPSDPKQISQVWFSGAHSDIGGGNTDHHLSDISLMWMIAKCAEDNKLEFDLKYYLLDNTKPEPEPAGSPWNTAMGVGKGNPGSGWVASAISAVTQRIEGQGLGVRSPMPKPGAQEAIHVSIQDRDLTQWPCKPLAGLVGQNQWALEAKPDARLTEAPLDAAGIELDYKGRVRGAIPDPKL